MHHVALATGQSPDLTAGALACARQLRAIVAHRYSLVGVGSQNRRPLHCGRVGGAGVVHGNWWNWRKLCKKQVTLKHVIFVLLFVIFFFLRKLNDTIYCKSENVWLEILMGWLRTVLSFTSLSLVADFLLVLTDVNVPIKTITPSPIGTTCILLNCISHIHIYVNRLKRTTFLFLLLCMFSWQTWQQVGCQGIWILLP